MATRNGAYLIRRSDTPRPGSGINDQNVHRIASRRLSINRSRPQPRLATDQALFGRCELLVVDHALRAEISQLSDLVGD